MEDARFWFRQDTFLFMHHPGQFTSSDSRTKLFLRSGRITYLDVTHETNVDLPRRRAEEEEEEENAPPSHQGHEMTCDESLGTGYDGCRLDYVAQSLLERHGCLPPYVLAASAPASAAVCKLEDMSVAEQKELRDDYQSTDILPTTSISHGLSRSHLHIT